jgi:hypothetical protein
MLLGFTRGWDGYIFGENITVIIENYEPLNFNLAICTQCTIDNKWSETVKTLLKEEFGEKLTNSWYEGNGLPGTHPFMIKFTELRSRYETKCLVIEYDDLSEAICLIHLEQLIKEFKEYVR